MSALPIIALIILPISERELFSFWVCSRLKYLQSSAVSIQCCVSCCSPSASVSLLTKCFLYRLLAHASAICAPTERDDRLTWSVQEYISSLGKDFVSSKIDFANFRAFLYT